MVLNQGNCHYIPKKIHIPTGKIDLNRIKIEKWFKEKLVPNFLDNKLKFDGHVKSLCRKA